MVKEKVKPVLVEEKTKKREKVKKALAKFFLWQKIKWPVFAFGGFLVIFLASFAYYSVAYGKVSYKNVFVGETDLGGKKQSEIKDILTAKSQNFLKNDFSLKYLPESGDAKSFTFKPEEIGLTYNVDKTAGDVYAVGRQGGAARSFYQQFKTLFFPYRVSASYNINDEALTKKIADIAVGIDIPEKDYSLNYAGNGVFELATEKQEGKRIDQDKIISNVKFLISDIEQKEVSFQSQTFKPQITEENAKKTLADANKILATGELKLTYDGKTFSLDVDSIAGFISSRPKKKELEIYILSEKVKKQVDAIASQIDRDAGNAILTANNGVVSVSSESQNGLKVDRTQVAIDIENAILSRIDGGAGDGISLALKVNVEKPEIDSAKLAAYGLKELVATGTTNFVKSPTNRIHNITIGASAINGALIKPGEEFSTLARLGKIDASTGYLPELVIKNNKTVPDYGGGLCQVSTTLFRTALNAGMKITARQNHSYRVSYYEPPIGMDATIFDPAPDFKFVNNYSSYIFVQSKIVGTKITFEFYGTKDSRVVEIGQATGYDYVEPPAPVETIDPTLPAGTRNLVSHSHQGASAKFHYKVSKDGQILQETDFLSKYVALPEIWVVASPEAPAPAPTDPAATPPV